ncbi:MAG: hypothetical protein JXA71_14440 [Chitinispirillaceae bacterium]|nr:hypothetical protein [Chitinispirillaceae bacterium]
MFAEPRNAFRRCAIVFFPAALALTMVCAKPKEASQQSLPQQSGVKSIDPAPFHQMVDDSAEIKGVPGQLQSVDVLSGNRLNKSVFKDINGKRIYFCCPICKENFEQRQEYHLAAVKKKGILLADTTPSNRLEDIIQGSTGIPQSVDVVSGKPINQYVFTDLKNGKRLYHCCTVCRDSFYIHQDEYLDAIKKRGILLHDKPQADY